MTEIQKSITKKITEHFGKKPIEIEKLANGLTNDVYKIDEQYIIKILKSKYFPEKGKLEYIQRSLEEKNIKTAKNLVNVYRDTEFEYGYVIQEYIKGEDALTIVKNEIEAKETYQKLGSYMKKVHTIKFNTYGYIGDNVKNYSDYFEYIENDLNSTFKKIEQHKILRGINSDNLKQYILLNLKLLKHITPTLCHNDIRLGNVMIENDDIILIDWDNSISENWIQDYSRMTYEALTTENIINIQELKESFLSTYKPEISIDKLEKFEKIYHLRQGLRMITYFKEDQNTQYSKRVKALLLESLKYYKKQSI